MYPIRNLYKEISGLKSLKPTRKVNRLFTELVRLVRTSGNYKNLANSEIKNLRKICSEAEFELESFWAKKIITSKNPKEVLEKFPYFSNYSDLTHLEWNSLKACKLHEIHKNVLFIGGGPLPLTAIILAKEYNVNITVIDSDNDAINISKKLVEKLELNKKIKIIHSSANSFDNYGEFEVIFIASLVGDSIREKTKVFQKIRAFSKNGTHLLARSSYGKRKLLYQPLSKSIYEGFKPLIEVRPLNEIINSVIVLKL